MYQNLLEIRYINNGRSMYRYQPYATIEKDLIRIEHGPEIINQPGRPRIYGTVLRWSIEHYVQEPD